MNEARNMMKLDAWLRKLGLSFSIAHWKLCDKCISRRQVSHCCSNHVCTISFYVNSSDSKANKDFQILSSVTFMLYKRELFVAYH